MKIKTKSPIYKSSTKVKKQSHADKLIAETERLKIRHDLKYLMIELAKLANKKNGINNLTIQKISDISGFSITKTQVLIDELVNLKLITLGGGQNNI